MTAPTPTPADQQAPPDSNERRRSLGRTLRWLRRASMTLLLIVLATGILLAGMSMTDSGTRTAWRVAVWALQGKLAGEYGGGNLAQGLHLRQLRYHDASMQLNIDRIDASWHLALLRRQFSVSYLRAGNIELTLQPTPATPTVLPTSLRLPLALQLSEFSWQHLQLQQGSSNTALGQLSLHGNSDGMHHTLILDRLDTGFGMASGSLQLEGRKPYATSGAVVLSNLLQEKFRLAAQLSGSLQELGIAISASGDQLNGNAEVIATPFAAVPLKRASMALQHINPHAFNSAAPYADLSLHADLQPSADAAATALHVSGKLELINALAGSIDQQRLPLQSLHANLKLGIEQQEVSELHIALLKHGSVNGAGQFLPATGSGEFHLHIDALDLQTLHQQLRPSSLHGPVALIIKPAGLDLTAQLQDSHYAIVLDGTLNTEMITLRQARLAADGANLNLSGALHTGGDMAYSVNGELQNFNPAVWLSNQAATARINMRFDASGALTPQIQSKLAFSIRDSSYNNLPMRGDGTLQLNGSRLLPSKLELLVAGNHLQLQGAFGTPADRLAIHLDAPQLARLGYGLAGALKLDGQLSGSLQAPSLRATYSGTQLAFGAHTLASMSGQADIQSNLTASIAAPGNKLTLTLDGSDYRGPDATLQRLKLALNGTYGAHVLTLQADGKIRGQTLALQLDAHGKLSQDRRGYAWSGVIDRFDNQGVPHLSLAAPLSLTLAPQTLIAGATRLNLDGMAIQLDSLAYQQGRLQSQGSAKALDIGRLLALAQQLSGVTAPFKSDLMLDGSWNFSLAEQASGFIDVQRKSGDLWLPGSGSSPVLPGLSALQLRIDLGGTTAHLHGQLSATRIGSLQLQGDVGLLRQDGLLTLGDASPLALTALLDVPQLQRIAALLGPQYALEGKLALAFKAEGSLGAPRLSGTINGDQLAVTLYDQGIRLKDGIARLSMDGEVIDLHQLEFHGSSGTLKATGKVKLGDADPDLQATIVAEQLELLASPDRQLMLSGQAQLTNNHNQLRIDGKFIVDKALFDLPKSSAPKLSDDVVIVHPSGKTASAVPAGEQAADRFAPVMNIMVDLGNNFRFKGSGADLRLRGDMTVHSEPLQTLRATGTLNVTDGSYEAFGTKLNIERGIINFQGPINNPNLNILAMRRNQDVAAGVEVTGFVSQPRIKLVSEPTVADDDKLSWLMFGHGSDSSGLAQRSASSQAMALLGNYGGKKIAKDIGFDQFSIGASESGLTDEQVVSLGKAITDKLSLGYEQSLTGAASIAKATWQLSKRWSAVIRTGTINGLNFVYSLRFD